MKNIYNISPLVGPDDKPYLLKDESGERGLSLAEWIIIMLGQLPKGSLTTADGWKSVEVMRSCNLAKKNKTEISLEDDHYDWLKIILFDDERGKQLHQELKGSYALNAFGFVAMEVKRGLETSTKSME